MSQDKRKPKTYLDRGPYCIILESAGDNPFAVKTAIHWIKGIPLTQVADIIKNAPVVIFKNIAQHEAAEIQTKLEAAGATIQQVDHDELAQFIVRDIRRQTEMDALQTELTDIKRKLIQAQNGNGVGTEQRPALSPASSDTNAEHSKIYDVNSINEHGMYLAKRNECHAKGWTIVTDESLGAVVQGDTVRLYRHLIWVETPAAIQPVPETDTAGTSSSDSDADNGSTPCIVSVTPLTIQPGPTRPIKPTVVDVNGDGDAPNVFTQYRENLARQKERNMIPFQQAVERARNFTPSTIPGRGGQTA